MSDDVFAWAAEGEVEAQPKAIEPEIEETLPSISVGDTRVAATALLRFRQEVQDLHRRSSEIKLIRNDDLERVAISMGAVNKKIYKRLEEIRHHFVDPLHTAKKSIDGWFKEYTDTLLADFRYLETLLGNYRKFKETEQRRIRAEQEAEVRKIAEDQKKEADKAALQGVLYEPAPLPPVVTPEVPKVVRTGEGSASQRRVVKLKVLDESLIPEEYWLKVRNDAKIFDDLKDGIAVPGATLEEEFITQIRTT